MPSGESSQDRTGDNTHAGERSTRVGRARSLAPYASESCVSSVTLTVDGGVQVQALAEVDVGFFG